MGGAPRRPLYSRLMPMEINSFLARFKGVRPNGSGWSALCPAHEDQHNSLTIAVGDKGIVLHCHAGCGAETIVAAVGLTLRDLFPDDRNVLSCIPSRSRADVQTGADHREKPQAAKEARRPTLVAKGGITLADYAKAKALPIEFLQELGLRDRQRDGRPAISMPYLDVDGRVLAVRYRIALVGDRFRWRTGSKSSLYGLWRLDQVRKSGHAAIVEGESDCHAAWYRGVPAIGLPGAANWREDRDARHFDGIDKIYVVLEPDSGGQAVLKWLSGSVIKDRVHLVRLDGHKDLAAPHVAAGDGFDQAWQKAIASATPFSEIEAKRSQAERERARETCRHLLDDADILSRFADAIAIAGVVGEIKTARLIYLALTSRFFPRPISIVVKGVSSAGKSYTIKVVLGFFPEDATYMLTGMSERALAYSDEPLENRFIIIYEASGLESDFATYLLRSLLSEGHIRYETVEKTPDGIKPRVIERKGPTGCLLTTTETRLHPENETRMLSVTADDSREQTRAILDRLADDVEVAVDLQPWHALQTWLKGANHRVVIPYAKKLAAMVPEIAVRLRRDFHHVLTLIKAHALLHQCTREKDDNGRIIATVADYAVVHDLIAGIIAEGVDATVRKEVRQTVEAVKGLLANGRDHVTVNQVAEVLHLDGSTVSRRVAVARSLGYLRNEETRRGMPAKLVIGDKMPAEVEVLPHPDRLGDRLHVCTSDRGDTQTNNSPDPMVEEVV
jgi:hypothetical protein